MGCIGRLGCLIAVALLAIGAFLTREQWLPRLTGRPATTASAAVSVWQPLSPEAGKRGKRKIDDLSSPSGPVFSNLTASEVASTTRKQAGSLPVLSIGDNL